jgi:hypothetical protein
VTTIEVGLINSNDTEFTLSFGQVLAMFMIVPPLIEVVRLLPRLWRWFIDLAWVRFITRRPQRPIQSRLSSMDLTPLKYNDDTKEDLDARRPALGKHESGYSNYSTESGGYVYQDAWDAKVDLEELPYDGIPGRPYQGYGGSAQTTSSVPASVGRDTRGSYAKVER